MNPDPSDIENTAGRVIEVTNTLGATAADIQAAGNAIRTARQLAAGAARRPERLAMAGVVMIAAAGLLALFGDRSPGAPTQSQQAG